MPYIEPRRNARGEVTSYRIVVSDGIDFKGDQIRRRCIWTPPRHDMTERQMLKEATAAAYKFEEQVKNGYMIDQTQKFCDYAQYVLDLKERTGVRPSTIDRYIELLRRINPAIGHLPLGKIRPQHLNELYKDLQVNGTCSNTTKAIARRTLNNTLREMEWSKGRLARESGVAASTITAATAYKPISMKCAEAIAEALEGEFDEFFKVDDKKVPLSDKTVLEHHRLISTILAQAEKEMIVVYNAAAKATPPRPKAPKPTYYQPDEMDDILKALEDEPLRWKAITYLLIDTGCRRGEVMGLKWDNVELDTGLLIIDHALLYTASKGTYEGETKTGKPRAVMLAPQSLELLNKWHTEQLRLRILNGDRWVRSNFIFTHDDGTVMNPDSITSWLRKFSERHNLPHIHPHAFRHTAASTMIANGIDLVTAASELGHANATTTANIYAHQIAVAKARAAKVRGGVFSTREQPAKKKKKA